MIRTRNHSVYVAIVLALMLVGYVQPASSQGFFGNLKKVVKKVDKTLTKVNESLNGFGEASPGQQNQTQRQVNGFDGNVNTQRQGTTLIPESRTNTTQSKVAARPTQITPLTDGDNFSVTALTINNVGLGMPIVRLRNSGIFLSDSGMGLIGKLSVNVKGQAGKRLIMVFEVLDENGEHQADSEGNTAYALPLQVNRANESFEMEVRIPYTWTNLQEMPKALNFEVSLLDFAGDKDDLIVGASAINMDPLSIAINGNAVQDQALRDMLGGGSLGGLDLGGLMGAMLGGSDTAEQTCVKCDGTGICEYCDGDAFFDPSVCRKCAQSPGICRHCQGTGTTTVKLDISRSVW